jgi:hypothetical protein
VHRLSPASRDIRLWWQELLGRGRVGYRPDQVRFYTYAPCQLNTTAKMTGREAFWAHDLAWCRGAYVERNGGTNAMQFATVPPLLVELDPVPPARSGVFLTRLTEGD